MERNERLAVASLTGTAEAYAQLHRLDWQSAMTDVQECLAHWKVAAGRVGEVLSHAAARYIDTETPGAPAALQLLIDAGADLDRAGEIDEERKHRPGIRFGDAQFGS
jgi:hypothetical protein